MKLKNKYLLSELGFFIKNYLIKDLGQWSKKYTSQQINPNTLEANSLKLEYEDRFINIDSQDIWILNSRSIKYLNQNQEEEIQKFNFEDISLLEQQSNFYSTNLNPLSSNF